MSEEKTRVVPDIELGSIPAEPDTVRDGQRVDEKSPQDITNEYAKYAGGVPDGGFKAWSVIVGSMLATFCTLGYVNSSWGIFQEYYERALLSNKSPSTIAWIGSVQAGFVSPLSLNP
ncbi:hypothetical protein F5141DRAFT_218036 [Pisolithus sp. B1]|nr:hypothetical protein F5141DRAFT_218036 [Pisolithus sp. B1]